MKEISRRETPLNILKGGTGVDEHVSTHQMKRLTYGRRAGRPSLPLWKGCYSLRSDAKDYGYLTAKISRDSCMCEEIFYSFWGQCQL
jgi:hypothetical protein